MVRDAVRGYWALASGLTEVTRQRAMTAARALVAQGEATAEQVGSLAEELISTSMTNRTALRGLIQHEIDRARTAVGGVTAADLDTLSARVDVLSAQLAALQATALKVGKAANKATKPTKTTATKTTATKTTATKTAKAAKTTPTKRTQARGRQGSA